MSSLNDKQRVALLEATLREILRIEREAATDRTSVGFDAALDGKLLRQWLDIKRKAEHLLANP